MSRFTRAVAISCLLIISVVFSGCGAGGGVSTGGGTQNHYTLTVVKSGTGSGTITSSPAGINCGSTCFASYNAGTTVTLTATPASGSTLMGWSGGGCSGTGPCAVPLNASTSVTATLAASSTPVAPVIGTFTATPSAVVTGTTSITWAWTYSNTPTPAPTCTIDQSVGTVANGAATSVTLTADTVFTLTCGNSAGSNKATTTITTSAVQPPQYELFDDFSYSSPSDANLTTFGWSARTGTGAPGNMTWLSSNITFSSGIMTLTGHITSTSGGGTADGAELDWNQYKMLNGTYAARVHYMDTPDAGSCAHVNEAPFWAMSDYDTTHATNNYSEVDFEYLPCGGWGLAGPWQTFTTWKNDVTSNGSIEKDMKGSWDGWHTVIFVVQAGQPVKWYDNNILVSTADDAAYTPRSPMQIIPQIWFIDNTVISTWHTDIDWVYYVKDTVMTGDQVTAAVTNLRNQGLARKNTLP